MEVLAVIPVKHHRKAMPVLGGKPLIQWTLDAALASDLIKRLIVSSQDDAILEYCRGYTETMRGHPALYQGDVDVSEVVLDVLATCYDDNGYTPDAVMMLLPASPFRTARHIDEAIELWRRKPCQAVVGVRRAQDTPETVRVIKDGYLIPIMDDSLLKNSRCRTPLYRVNGAIFLASERMFVMNRTFHLQHTLPYLMPTLPDSLEVRTEDDIDLAGTILRQNACKATSVYPFARQEAFSCA